MTLAVPAWANGLTVLTAGAIRSVAEAVTPAFEASSGHDVTLRNDTVGALVRLIEAGEPFDVVLMSPAGLSELEKTGKVGAGIEVARVGIGVGVRVGFPAPDIGSVGAFRTTMLRARKVAMIDPASGGSSGIYLAELFQRLGIADAMAAKTVLVSGGLAATAVVDGRADLVLQQISEVIGVPGIELVGPLPPEIQHFTRYSGAVATWSRAPDAAHRFLDALTGPAGRNVLAAKGMAPP